MGKNTAIILNMGNEFKEAFDEISLNAKKELDDGYNIVISRPEVIPTIATIFIENIMKYCRDHKDCEINLHDTIAFKCYSTEQNQNSCNNEFEIRPLGLALKLVKDVDEDEDVDE